MRKTNQKGFTIIELLVVIVIIGILVALTLPNLFSAQARGRDTDRKNELKNLQQKLETYFNDNDEYPAALSNLDPAPTTDETTGPT
jgi:type II secretion system protein G